MRATGFRASLCGGFASVLAAIFLAGPAASEGTCAVAAANLRANIEYDDEGGYDALGVTLIPVVADERVPNNARDWRIAPSLYFSVDEEGASDTRFYLQASISRSYIRRAPLSLRIQMDGQTLAETPLGRNGDQYGAIYSVEPGDLTPVLRAMTVGGRLSISVRDREGVEIGAREYNIAPLEARVTRGQALVARAARAIELTGAQDQTIGRMTIRCIEGYLRSAPASG